MAYRNFAMTPALERQMQLWNQLLEANRSIWALYAPWLQVAPWFLNATVVSEPEKIEKEALVDGVPDALELQARTWNHLLEANKTFWSAFAWPLDGTPAAASGLAERDDGGDVAEPTPSRKTRSRSPAH